MVHASRRVLMQFRTAPDIGTENWSSYMAGMLGARTETTSPEEMERDDIEEASWRQRR